MILVKAVKDVASIEQAFLSYQEAKQFALFREAEGYFCILENHPNIKTHEELGQRYLSQVKETWN